MFRPRCRQSRDSGAGSTAAAGGVTTSAAAWGATAATAAAPLLPEEAVVGATLVDPARNVTEMILTFPADTAAVVDYYEQNLPPRGYTILSSDGSETVWRIVFTDSDADGEMGVQAAGSGIAAATVQFSER